MPFRESKFEKFIPYEKKEKEIRKEYGENVHEIITCMRHGPKREIGDTLLSEKAEKVIQKSIGGFNLVKDGIKIFTSESKPERCQETGRIISKLLKDYKREQRAIRPLTGLQETIASEEEEKSLGKIFMDLLPENYKTLSVNEKEKAERQMENKIILAFLQDSFPKLIRQLEKEKGEIFPSKMEKFSHLETASRFAEWIKLCINASKWLPSEMKINLVNISHEFNLMAFLKEAVIFEDGTKAKDLKAKEFLEKIGGSIEPAEFFEIDVKRQDKENFETSLKFRDEDYDLDFSRIEELTKLARQKRKNKKQ